MYFTDETLRMMTLKLEEGEARGNVEPTPNNVMCGVWDGTQKAAGNLRRLTIAQSLAMSSRYLILISNTWNITINNNNRDTTINNLAIIIFREDHDIRKEAIYENI